MRLNSEAALVVDADDTSTVVDLRSCRLKSIRVPETWTDGDTTILACATVDGTYVPVKDMAGADVTITMAADTLVVIEPNALEGLPFVQFVADAAQTGDQLLSLETEPRS